MEKPPITSFGANDHSMRDGTLYYLQLNWETGITLLAIVLIILFICVDSESTKKKDIQE